MKSEIIEKLAALITAAFGLVAALAWNTSIQAIFTKYYSENEGIAASLIYALIVTVIAVAITIWIGRAAERAKKAEGITTRAKLFFEKRIKKQQPAANSSKAKTS